jgi:hypothetical protein
MDSRLPSGRTWVVLALVGLTGLALWERLRGIGMMLPHATQVDEFVTLRQLQVFRGADYDPETELFYALYPHLVSRTALLLPTDGGGAARPGMGLKEHLERARAPWLEVRAAAALLSLGIVPATYWLARFFLAPGWSLLAAAFAATSLLHAAFTQLARPHGPVTTFILLTVVASIHLRRQPSWKWYLLAGLSAALALGSLQSGLFALGRSSQRISCARAACAGDRAGGSSARSRWSRPACRSSIRSTSRLPGATSASRTRSMDR